MIIMKMLATCADAGILVHHAPKMQGRAKTLWLAMAEAAKTTPAAPRTSPAARSINVVLRGCRGGGGVGGMRWPLSSVGSIHVTATSAYPFPPVQQ